MFTPSPMRVILFLLALIFQLTDAERLSEHRRSCDTKTVFFKTENHRSKDLELRNPGHDDALWETAVNYACDRGKERNTLKEKTADDFLTLFHMIQELRENEVLHKNLTEKLFNVTFTEDHFNFTGTKIEAYNITNNFPHHYLPSLNTSQINKDDDVMLMDQSLIRDVRCIPRGNGYFIQFSVEVMIPKKQKVWMCEDIGVSTNDHYDFYLIRPVWMFDLDNRTVYFDETECLHDFSLCDVQQLFNATCSVEDINQCALITMTRGEVEKSVMANVRQLAGGIAVYGAFQSITEHPEDVDPVSALLDWGLYYLSYNE